MMNGSLPSLEFMYIMTIFDVSYNNFDDNTDIGDVSSSLGRNETGVICDMSHINFACPVTWQSYAYCGAR